MSKLIAWSLEVVDFQILSLLVLIDAEVEVALSGYLGIGVLLESLELLLGELVLESHLGHLVLDQGGNLRLDTLDSAVVTCILLTERSKKFLPGVNIAEHVEVLLLLGLLSLELRDQVI